MVKRYCLWVVMALVIVVSVLAGCVGRGGPTSPGAARVQDVTSREAFSLIQENTGDPDFIILDVRTASEFTAGHIAGALNVDMNMPSFRDEMGKLDKNKTYLVYCRTGNRSSSAVRVMGELGFRRIYHLANGITEWDGAGLPVVR